MPCCEESDGLNAARSFRHVLCHLHSDFSSPSSPGYYSVIFLTPLVNIFGTYPTHGLTISSLVLPLSWEEKLTLNFPCPLCEICYQDNTHFFSHLFFCTIIMWQNPTFPLLPFVSYFLSIHIPFSLQLLFGKRVNCQAALFSHSSDPSETGLCQCRKQDNKKRSVIQVMKRRKPRLRSVKYWD